MHAVTHKPFNEITSKDLARTWGDLLKPKAFSANLNVRFMDGLKSSFHSSTEKVGSVAFPHDNDMEFVGMLPISNADRLAAWSARKVMALGEILNLVIPFARLAGILGGGIVRFAVFVVALVCQLPFVILVICLKLLAFLLTKCWEGLVAAKRAIRQDDTVDAQAKQIKDLNARMAVLEAQVQGGLHTVALTPAANAQPAVDAALDALVQGGAKPTGTNPPAAAPQQPAAAPKDDGVGLGLSTGARTAKPVPVTDHWAPTPAQLKALLESDS